MATVILTNADLYAEMASSFYRNYLHAERELSLTSSRDYNLVEEQYIQRYHLINERKKNATAAIVFQALAIESYINLFGMYTIGEAKFYGDYERTASTKKLQEICSFIGTSYPKDHLARLEALFMKRNRLVHEKPKKHSFTVQSYDYQHPEKSKEDINAFFNEDNYVYINLSDEINLYEELQQHIKALRGSELELINEIHEAQSRENMMEISQAIESMYTHFFTEN